MDPVTVGAVLTAIAGGAGDAIGGQLWAGVSALVRRPFRYADREPAGEPASGAAELAALERAPQDQARAVALAEVLVARAAADADFRRELESWWAAASQVQTGPGDTANTISGGTFQGPVLQGRDFTGLTFGGPPAPPADTSRPDSSS
jgi:hypothetical protein